MNESDTIETLVPAVTQPQNIVETKELNLSADTMSDMEHCQKSLKTWCAQKIATLQAEHAELSEAHDHALNHKWKTSVLKAHRDKTMKRIEYYQKMLAAVNEGYLLVPNFPVTLFAVRTDRKYPKSFTSFSNWTDRSQKPEVMPGGEGEYKNPDPIVMEKVAERNLKRRYSKTLPATRTRPKKQPNLSRYWTRSQRSLSATGDERTLLIKSTMRKQR